MCFLKRILHRFESSRSLFLEKVELGSLVDSITKYAKDHNWTFIYKKQLLDTNKSIESSMTLIYETDLFSRRCKITVLLLTNLNDINVDIRSSSFKFGPLFGPRLRYKTTDRSWKKQSPPAS